MLTLLVVAGIGRCFYLYRMNVNSFRDSLASGSPPSALSVYAEALWYDAKGNWHRAHELIQDLTDKNAAWIHAYLHRKEGDTWNADYWYNKAGRKRPNTSLTEEWDQITAALL
jgi:hypothetical protein